MAIKPREAWVAFSLQDWTLVVQIVYDVFPASGRLTIQARTKLANNPPLEGKRVVSLLLPP